MPLFGPSKKSHARAEEEAEQHRNRAKEFDSELARARQDVAAKRTLQAQRDGEMKMALATTSSLKIANGRLATNLEQARIARQRCIEELEASERLRATDLEVVAITQKRLRRLEEMHVVLQTASSDARSQSSSSTALVMVPNEANDQEARALQDLQAGLAASASKVSAVGAETELSRAQHDKLNADLAALREKHAALDAQHQANLAGIAAATAKAADLRVRLLEAKDRLEQQQQETSILQGRHEEVLKLIHTCGAQLKVLPVIAVPVLDLTSDRKQEDWHKHLMSPTSTTSTVTPWPSPTANWNRASDFALVGRLVVT